MAALTTLMTRFCAGEDSWWLAAATYQGTLALRIPRKVTVDHITKNTSAATMAITPRIRQSMPNSEALNPVSGKSHSKEVLRARLVWTGYSITRVKYMTPH